MSNLDNSHFEKVATKVQKSSFGIGTEKTANFVSRFIKFIYGNQ
jgi:hypothetical protein